MRVGFNILPLQTSHSQRGMGQYTRCLLEALKKIGEVEIEEFRQLKKVSDVDLVHYPYFDPFFTTLPLLKKFPTVVTIGDVTPLLFPEHYPAGIKGTIKKIIQTFSLQNVKAVITFSKSAAEDIHQVLKIKNKKIFPIYLAPSNEFKKLNKSKLVNIIQKYHLPEEFGLFVGSVNWNKNLINLTESCLRANIKLVFIGKDFEKKDNLDHPELKSYKEFVEKYSANPNIITLGFIETKDLVSIYNLANFLLLTSFYEGFGLTILEAQACGCPVITSNLSAMPEVAGKGAVYIDPHSIDDIFRGINEIRVKREKLVNAGFENVKRFSWEKCAKDTVKVYEYAFKH